VLSSISTSEKTRNPVPDLLKGIAVIFMIQVHIMELFALDEIFNSTIGSISLFLGGPPAAPLFMVIMGYFLFFSSRPFIAKIKRGILIFIGGIALNIGLNFHLLYRIWTGEFDINPYPYIFGADILPLAGLSIIIISFLNSENFKNSKSVFCFPFLIFLMIIPLALSSFLNDVNSEIYSPLSYLQAFLFGSFWWSYFPLFPWLFYPLLGFAVAAFLSRFSIRINKLFLILPVLIILILTFDFALSAVTDLPTYYHHDFLLALWISLFLLVFYYTALYKESLLGNSKIFQYIKWIGRNVTLLYIFQWLLIGNIATAIYKTQPLYSLPFWFLLILLLASLMTYLYKKFTPTLRS
jgi:uncharacterized membrane protein